MRFLSKRLIYSLSNKIQQNNQEDSPEDRLIVDFKKAKKSPFDIKSETSYNSYLSNGALVLELKKTNCIAWAEIPQPQFSDHVIDAKIRLDSLGGYASTGIIFRLIDQESYYLALVSSKGYFRLDVVKDNSPKALIAWTEISDFDGTNIGLSINTYGNYLFFLVNEKWVGEINDDSVNSGKIGFVLASYEEKGIEDQGSGIGEGESAEEFQQAEIAANEQNDLGAAGKNDCTCRAWLDYLTIDGRSKTIEEKYKKWTDESNINAEERLRLAETFAVMGKSSKGMEQISKAWKRRDEAIRSASITSEEVRTKRELLLAARMSFDLAQYNEAEEYIDLILEQWPNSAEGTVAKTEKIKILNELNKSKELKEFVLKYPDTLNKDINYYTMLARCHFELQEYKESAEIWKTVFRMNPENGIYAANAANAYELTGKKKDALKFYLEAGKLFLKEDNQGELSAIMPKLSVIGGKNWEARALLGKWAYSIEDYARCAADFTAAEKLRCALKPRPAADPALFYLWGLVLSIKGKNKDAVRLLERAVKLAPDYGLFRFKLAEIRLLSGEKNQHLADELKLALDHYGDDSGGVMAAHAGNLLLKAGYQKKAQYFFNRANNAGN